MRSHELGLEGEQKAVFLLRSKGYEILERNWRFGKFEIDILAQKGNILAVIEVKTRSTDLYGSPEQYVYKQQLKRLISAVNAYVNMKDLEVEVRIDIIAIIGRGSEARMQHIEDACFHF